MNEFNDKGKHTVFVQNRDSMELEGIKDVGGFNEEVITAESECGGIVIRGNNLHVDELNLELGKLKISGRISAFIYNDKVAGKGFWGRVFS